MWSHVNLPLLSTEPIFVTLSSVSVVWVTVLEVWLCSCVMSIGLSAEPYSKICEIEGGALGVRSAMSCDVLGSVAYIGVAECSEESWLDDV